MFAAKQTILFGKDFPFSSVVRVTSSKDLSGQIDSSVLYLIDGDVDMGADQIKVPEGGIVIHGLDFNVSSLTTSEDNHTLFIVDPAGAYSGDVIMRDMAVTVSGTNSQVFDLDNDGNNNAVECTDFNFVNCTSLGELTAYRQGLWSEFAIVRCSDGLTMSGTWSGGFAILTAIVVSAGVPFNGTILKEGTSLVVNGSIRADLNALQLGGSGAISDLQPSNITNDAEFRMSGVRCNPAATPFPNMPSTSVKAVYSRCAGFRNTYIGGRWSVSSESGTSCSVADTYYKVGGASSYADLNHVSGTGDNLLTYLGEDEIGIRGDVTATFTAPNNAECVFSIRQWDESASGYIDLVETGQITAAGTSKPLTVPIHAFGDFNQDDRLELWVKIVGGTGTVTLKQGGLVSIEERAS